MDTIKKPQVYLWSSGTTALYKIILASLQVLTHMYLEELSILPQIIIVPYSQ